MAKGIYVGVSALPTGYTQVEYIQSSGTQYIDTRFYPNNNTRVVMDAQITTIGTKGQFFFGARGASYAKSFAFMYSTDGPSLKSSYGTANTKATSKDFTARMLIDKNKNVCTLNSEVITHTASTFQSTIMMYLFASNENGTTNYYATMRLYSCQIYDNGTLIRNFVPCKNASGVAGLYDLVNKLFFTNSGSGTFTVGATVTEQVGVGRKIQRAYVGINGVARKIARGYVGVNGVARRVFPNAVKWEKWTADSVSGYEEVGQYASHSTSSGSSYYETFYDDYEFSTTDGVTMIGEADYLMPDEIDSIVGLYLEGTTSDGKDAVWQITESGYQADGKWYYNWEAVLVYESADTWEATGYIGEIEAEEGALPEDGELIEGSADDYYCVLYLAGEGYFYYYKQ